MRILIAQEDAKVVEIIKQGLLVEGFDIDIVSDGEMALWYAKEGHFSAIILDILLPKMNGFYVCENIRKKGIRTPIMMLTTKCTTNDEIDSLEVGADDFLPIPFTKPLLAARINALVRRRRNRGMNDNIIFGSLCYNQKDRKCIFDKQEVLLTSREGKVLEMLMLAEGEIVPKHSLINYVWGVEFSGNPNIVDVYIGYLRRKICAGYNNNFVQTIRGVGYRLINGM